MIIEKRVEKRIPGSGPWSEMVSAGHGDHAPVDRGRLHRATPSMCWGCTCAHGDTVEPRWNQWWPESGDAGRIPSRKTHARSTRREHGPQAQPAVCVDSAADIAVNRKPSFRRRPAGGRTTRGARIPTRAAHATNNSQLIGRRLAPPHPAAVVVPLPSWASTLFHLVLHTTVVATAVSWPVAVRSLESKHTDAFGDKYNIFSKFDCKRPCFSAIIF